MLCVSNRQSGLARMHSSARAWRLSAASGPSQLRFDYSARRMVSGDSSRGFASPNHRIPPLKLSFSSCWHLSRKYGRVGAEGFRESGRRIATTRIVGSKFDRGVRRVGRKRTKLEDGIQKGFKKVGLEAQYNNLPQWSGAVPYVVVGLETVFMVTWAAGLRGRTLQVGVDYLSGDGLLIIMLGFNFVVGWLASQVSTWRVQRLAPSLLPREKRSKTKPGFFDFLVSFWINFIPFGNFLAWLRTAVKEGRAESAANALVYIVPSLFRLVLWTQGISLGRVEQVAWLLGAIHRPYDAARLRNDRLIAAVELRQEKASREKDGKDALSEEPQPKELTLEEMAIIQQRKELEEFDMLLAKSTNSTSAIPGSPEDWSVGDVLQWLAKEGFARYATNFAENDIDGSVLMQLTIEDLRDELGIQSLGDRKKFEKSIEQLKSKDWR
ncbi:hypothetical protein AXG93_523s1020 [Marchantia polymorpha subsp. ruderalis]|uniref:SAM domain-containing protein n=1 Tax=Marchantia polymorpha subsp. ruderalis TaxID=1480154 RepID=A0A176VW12_MARPO|nr:hypothetical protein AXG93_523s1020 [Marchantia polymorpha subsp. ruderalis]